MTGYIKLLNYYGDLFAVWDLCLLWGESNGADNDTIVALYQDDKHVLEVATTYLYYFNQMLCLGAADSKINGITIEERLVQIDLNGKPTTNTMRVFYNQLNHN